VKVCGNSDGKIDAETVRDMISKYRGGFMYWLMSCGGSAMYKQMFYLVFVLEYKGLSRSGISLLHHMRAALPIRTYDLYRKQVLARVETMHRYM
jgi:hypothetical protein